VFILQYHLSSKYVGVVRKTFSNAYSDEEEPNKIPSCTRISAHSKRLYVTSAHGQTKQLELQPYRFKAVHQLQRDTAARIQYCHWFHCFERIS
jgi:hypothetical protein